MGTAAFIAHNLEARRQGKFWRCPCPVCGDYALSFADGADGGLQAKCWGGCSYYTICTALLPYGLLDDADAGLAYGTPIGTDADADRDLRIDAALWQYTQASGELRLVHTYLHARSIGLTSPVLRFAPNMRHRLGLWLPAMLAPIVNVSGDQTGTHLTFLRKDGLDKASFSDRAYQRECRGIVARGVIRLAEPDPECPLIIGEGIESTLSAMELFALPGWAAIAASNLYDLALPADVHDVIIAADNDLGGCGQRAASAAHARWTAEGRQVRAVVPPVAGEDFNDIIIRRRAR